MLKPVSTQRRRTLFKRLGWVLATVGGVSLGVILCALFFQKAGDRCEELKSLNNAKGIYLALKMYAGDHDGRFPDAAENANEAYRQLVPAYIPSTKTFQVRGSAWTPSASANFKQDSKVLHPGENHFAYISCLKDNSNPDFPLVADGFVEGKPGTYAANREEKGGVWKGRLAIVVRVDGSGRLEKVNPTDRRVYRTTTTQGPGIDLFAPAPNWLDAGQLALNPASR